MATATTVELRRREVRPLIDAVNGEPGELNTGRIELSSEDKFMSASSTSNIIAAPMAR
jgi:hypothetical protein